MNWIPNIFRRRKLFDELSEEIRLHIEERTEQLIGEGMCPRLAEQEASRAFGNRTLVRAEPRSVALAHTGIDVGRRAIGGSPVAPFSRIYICGCFDAGIGYWRKRRGFCGIERADPAPSECSSCGKPLHNRARRLQGSGYFVS